MEKYTIPLKQSLLSLFAITLLISNFHAFSMDHVKREEVITIAPPEAQAERTQVEQELVLEDISEPESPITDMEDLPEPAPRKTRHRERKKKKSLREWLLSVFRKICGYSKPVGDDPVGAQHQIRLETNFTDIPMDCLEIIHEYLQDWDDAINFMATHSKNYLAGLRYLSRNIGKIGFRMSSQNPFRQVLNVCKSKHKTKNIFKKHISVRALDLAKNYLERLLRRIFFNNKKINQKIIKKYRGTGLREEKLKKLISSLNKDLVFNFSGYEMDKKQLQNIIDYILQKIKAIHRKKCQYCLGYCQEQFCLDCCNFRVNADLDCWIYSYTDSKNNYCCCFFPSPLCCLVQYPSLFCRLGFCCNSRVIREEGCYALCRPLREMNERKPNTRCTDCLIALDACFCCSFINLCYRLCKAVGKCCNPCCKKIGDCCNSCHRKIGACRKKIANWYNDDSDNSNDQ